MTKKFRDVEPLGCTDESLDDQAAYIGEGGWLCISQYYFDVEEARALRDWLDKALGDRPSSPPEILKEPT